MRRFDANAGNRVIAEVSCEGVSYPISPRGGVGHAAFKIYATLEVFTSTWYALILSAVGHFALRAVLGIYLRFLAVGGCICLGVVLWAFLDRELVRAVKLSAYISRDKRS